MGIVFEAEDVILHRRVALKVLRPGLVAELDSKQRFLEEAQAMALLNHDHVVTIYQIGEDKGLPYMAMQLLEGQTLDTRLHSGRQLSLSETVRVASEIALGLHAAHQKGLIHRDVKPGNVWLERPKGRVKLLDFGLCG